MATDIGTWRKGKCISSIVIKTLGIITVLFQLKCHSVGIASFFKGNKEFITFTANVLYVKDQAQETSFSPGLRILSMLQPGWLYLQASAENGQAATSELSPDYFQTAEVAGVANVANVSHRRICQVLEFKVKTQNRTCVHKYQNRNTLVIDLETEAIYM